MKRPKIPLLLAMVISTEMIISPLAHAQQPQATGLLGMVQAVGSVLGPALIPQGPTPQTMAAVGVLRQQGQPIPDGFFSQQKMSQIPGLFAYMVKNNIPISQLSCKTLPARPARVVADVCTQGFNAQPGPAMMSQMQDANIFKIAYGDIANEYQNYQVESTTAANQDAGLGCMRRAMQHLSGFFSHRVSELDSLVNNIEAFANQFKEASRADLMAVEELTAVLEGQGAGELLDEVRTRRPDLFDFGKNFKDPACSSMFASETFNEKGRGAG